MPHLDFLEKIAEGFVIEAYNSMKGRDEDKMSLGAYNLTRIERAIAEMRGEAPPSSGARGDAGATGATPGTIIGEKRERSCLEYEVEQDGRIAPHELETEEKHVYIEANDALERGLISDSYRKHSNFCAYKHCPHAKQNNEKPCGEKSKNKQAPRAKAPGFCMHPRCVRGFHGTCHAIFHRQLDPSFAF